MTNYDELRDVLFAIRLLPETRAHRVLSAALVMIGEYESASFALDELKRAGVVTGKKPEGAEVPK